VKILLHVCCGPCTIYPLRVLREERSEVCGLFYNPNVHPYQEYQKRLGTLETYASQEEFRVIREDVYPLDEFLRQIAFREEDRCRYCYELRLNQTAQVARRGGFDAFTTTLLYSRFQKHDLIRRIGEGVARTQGVPFLYRDFRDGWSEGARISKERGMYRQSYCGCIYSEMERYCRNIRISIHEEGSGVSCDRGSVSGYPPRAVEHRSVSLLTHSEAQPDHSRKPG
jgi:predicted adenine nucleotide alpha hydrolase (AANH) superfamily ATPase